MKFNKTKKIVAFVMAVIMLFCVMDLTTGFTRANEHMTDIIETTIEETTGELTEEVSEEETTVDDSTEELTEDITTEETTEVTEETTEEVTEETTEEVTEETTEETTEEVTEETTEETTEEPGEPDDITLVGYKIVEKYPISWNGWNSYVFILESPGGARTPALCGDNVATTPPIGAVSQNRTFDVNDNMRKVLSYWREQSATFESAMAMKFHLALDKAKHGTDHGSTVAAFYNECMNSAAAKTALIDYDKYYNTYFTPKKPEMTYTLNAGKYTYKTETIT